MTRRTVLGVAAASLLLAAVTLAAQTSSDVVERGRQAFTTNGCYGCHMIGAFGTPIGPDLSRVGRKYDAAYLERWLRDPALQRPTAHMPKLELSDADVRALAEYLALLR